MISRVTHVPLLVRDQQEALNWYTEKLGFEQRADDPFPNDPENRWVTISPKGQADLEIVLQPPHWGPGGDAEARAEMIGKQPGWVIVTDDCRKECKELETKGVTIVDPPMEMPWGVSALVADLYGNVHNLLEPRTPE
jgi:catechol 2,3-dioxygenase-like lactoylglutathione lyase family enzyme